MLWLAQLSFDLAQDSFSELFLIWLLLTVIDQLESEGTYCSLEPSIDTEILAVLDKLTVELAKGISGVFLG